MTPSNSDPNGRNQGSMPGSAGNGTTKQKIEEDARDAKREASPQAREQAEAGKHRLADEADTLSDAIDAAASQLDDDDREGLARYARELSSNLANAAAQLEDRSVDELANDAKRLARNNPALFMLGSIAVGFGLSRFFKASSDRDHRPDTNAYRTDAYRTGADREDDIFRAGDAPPGSPLQQRDRDRMQTNTTVPHNGDGRNMP